MLVTILPGFLLIGSRELVQVIWLGSKWLYPFIHPTSPEDVSWIPCSEGLMVMPFTQLLLIKSLLLLLIRKTAPCDIKLYLDKLSFKYSAAFFPLFVAHIIADELSNFDLHFSVHKMYSYIWECLPFIFGDLNIMIAAGFILLLLFMLPRIA